MVKIAFIYGNIPIYWDSILMTMAELTGLILFLAACRRRGKDFSGAVLACPIGIMLSLILSRLVHWYFRADSYDGFRMAMTDFLGPGHGLMGVFAALLLTACLLKMMGVIDSLPAMLDCMSFGGCAAIALGRLSCLFTSDDRGVIVNGWKGLPIAYPTMNPTSGALEYRFAVFFFQFLTAVCIFLFLLVLMQKQKKQRVYRDGDLTMLFLLMYCASQILWDSTRYDSLRLRRNGFISAVQLVCAFAVLTVLVIFSIRLGRRGQAGRWGLIVFGFGCAGAMEYYAQIRGDRGWLAYGIMGAALALIVAVGLRMWAKAEGTAQEVCGDPEEDRGSFRFLDALLLLLTGAVLVVMMLRGGPQPGSRPAERELDAAGRFFADGARAMADAVPGSEGSLSTPHYRIAGDIAPKPDRDRYGKAARPEEMGGVIAASEELLDGQTLYFSSVSEVLDDFGITYYQDETILTITWKQVIDNTVYTFSEIKIADPSQFRRYLAGGTYGSGKLVYPTEMANTVNSVVASSGDYFEFRNAGVIVYNGDVCRVGSGADTCYIDSSGNMSFTRAGDKMNMEAAEAYAQEHEIQFSLAFGPILVEDGELNQFAGYHLGEIDRPFSRAALCQMDELHYLLVNACAEGEYYRNLTMFEFARRIQETGCRMAYALDGGQTAAHMVSGVLVNEVTRGFQRKISDIIYFATALPNS